MDIKEKKVNELPLGKYRVKYFGEWVNAVLKDVGMKERVFIIDDEDPVFICMLDGIEYVGQ